MEMAGGVGLDWGEVWFDMRLLLHRIHVFLFGLWGAMRGLSKAGKGGVASNCVRFFKAWMVARIQLREYCELAYSQPDEASFMACLAARIESERFKCQWGRRYFENWRFLREYTSLKYDATPAMVQKRIKAYKKRFDIGDGTYIQYGVMVIAEHYSTGTLKAGRDCLLSRDCDLDVTGGLEIGNGVCILEGAKILTHAHDSLHLKKDDCLIPYSNRAYKTPLVIEDNVEICARAIIMPGVGRIGTNSMISAGAIVTKPVPPNSVVGGSPASVLFTLEGDIKLDTSH